MRGCAPIQSPGLAAHFKSRTTPLTPSPTCTDIVAGGRFGKRYLRLMKTAARCSSRFRCAPVPSPGTPGEGRVRVFSPVRNRRPSPLPSPGVPGEGEDSLSSATKRQRPAFSEPGTFSGIFISPEYRTREQRSHHVSDPPQLTMPHWMLASVFSFLPLAWGIRHRPRRRPGSGFCRSCGYDLSATPNRCPESGAVPKR